jgi:transposase
LTETNLIAASFWAATNHPELKKGLCKRSNIFRKFQKDGVWEAIWEELHMTLREQLGREASPTAAVIDSQTLKAAEKGAVMMAR